MCCDKALLVVLYRPILNGLDTLKNDYLSSGHGGHNSIMGPLRGLINESFCTKLFENLRKVGLSLERIHFVPVSNCCGETKYLLH